MIFFLLSYYFILSLFCTVKKKHTDCVTCDIQTHSNSLILLLLLAFCCVFFFFSSFDGVLLSCGYDLSLFFLCVSGAARGLVESAHANQRISCLLVNETEMFCQKQNSLMFIFFHSFFRFECFYCYIVGFVARSRSSLGPMCWFFFLLLDSIHNFALRLYKHSNLSFHCVQQFNHSIRFISLNCDRERKNWSNQKMKTNTLLEWAPRLLHSLRTLCFLCASLFWLWDSKCEGMPSTVFNQIKMSFIISQLQLRFFCRNHIRSQIVDKTHDKFKMTLFILLSNLTAFRCVSEYTFEFRLSKQTFYSQTDKRDCTFCWATRCEK